MFKIRNNSNLEYICEEAYEMSYEEKQRVLEEFQKATDLGTIACNVILIECNYNLDEALEYIKTDEFHRRFKLTPKTE